MSRPCTQSRRKDSHAVSTGRDGMIAAYHDPASMTREERVAEVARILAAGYLRSIHREPAQNRLATLDDNLAHVNSESNSEETA